MFKFTSSTINRPFSSSQTLSLLEGTIGEISRPGELTTGVKTPGGLGRGGHGGVIFAPKMVKHTIFNMFSSPLLFSFLFVKNDDIYYIYIYIYTIYIYLYYIYIYTIYTHYITIYIFTIYIHCITIYIYLLYI